MKTSPKLECDSLENPAANNHGCQVIGHTDATSALKEKILKRKLLLSKRKLSCRFPGLHAQTEVITHLWFFGACFPSCFFCGIIAHSPTAVLHPYLLQEMVLPHLVLPVFTLKLVQATPYQLHLLFIFWTLLCFTAAVRLVTLSLPHNNRETLGLQIWGGSVSQQCALSFLQQSVSEFAFLMLNPIPVWRCENLILLYTKGTEVKTGSWGKSGRDRTWLLCSDEKDHCWFLAWVGQISVFLYRLDCILRGAIFPLIWGCHYPWFIPQLHHLGS